MGLLSNVGLRAHQQNAVNKTVDKDGNLLMYHDVGTGKTLSSIAATEALNAVGKGGKTLVVTPASLRENFAKDGVKKFTNNSYTILGNKQELGGQRRKDIRDIDKLTPKTSSDYNIVSYDLFKRDPKKYILNTGAKTVIYDELHKAKNETSAITKVIKEARPFHRNFIGLTGSLTSNTPADMVPLVNAMTNGKHILGSKDAFESRFLKIDSSGKKTVKNKTMLQAVASPYVDFVDRDDMPNFSPPRRKKIEHEIIMGPEQSDVYRSVLDKLDAVTKAKLLVGVGKLNQKELRSVGNKLMGARQVSNAPHTVVDNMSMDDSYETSSKARALIGNVKKHLNETKDGQVIIGTQFIRGGVDVLSHGLKKEKIPFVVFSGKGNKGVTEKSRQQAVTDYNTGKAKAILITSAGGEGLNLPNTTSVHMLDGHFNPEVINQMEARGIRSGGLSHRKEVDRVVELNRYIAKPDIKASAAVGNLFETINPGTYIQRILNNKPLFQKPSLREFSADDFIDRVAKQKHENNSEMKNLFKTAKNYLGSEAEILEDYYKDIGTDKIMGAMSTGDFIDREKEQKHIDRLRSHYKNVAKAKKYELIQTKNAGSKFTKDDFHEDGTLKTSSKYNIFRNKNLLPGLALTLGGSAGGVYLLRRGLKTHNDKLVTPAAQSMSAGLLGGLVLAEALSSEKTFSPTKKAIARKRAKLKDGDLLRMLRGENVMKEQIKVENHALG
jgi:superfamily II DNA or RNA helicase